MPVLKPARTRSRRQARGGRRAGRALRQIALIEDATVDVSFWMSKEVEEIVRGHLNCVVADTREQEQSDTHTMFRHGCVEAVVKNKQLGFSKRGSVDALMDYLRQFADAGCAVLAVSAVARTKDKRGRSSYVGDGLSLASFRESSELEYGADTAYVLVPSRDDPEAVTLRCLKHRHGQPVDVSLCFERRIQSFRPTEPAPATPADRGKLTASLRALWGSTPAAADDDGGDE